MQNLIEKYNVPGPRYTSYPTVPYWQTADFKEELWIGSLKKAFSQTNSEKGISLYIHLPYCESLCTFCGCNKRITKNHAVEMPYIQALLKEWSLYAGYFDEKPIVSEIHLGGGTPTFFSAESLEKLLQGILNTACLSKDFEFSFEGHPNNTTFGHLQKLYDLGFRRVSFGVQDYDPIVQKAIHRIQPFEHVRKVTDWSREIGYDSISHDLVYGLPFQKLSGIIDTIEKTIALKPDRLSFYSYAHVPWLKGNGQRGYREEDLPSAVLKRELYETGRDLFEKAGYSEIGMDHFALPGDKMFAAAGNQQLHRNFMGYTTSQTKVLIGLGVSSISDSWYGFAQNTKDLDKYYAMINANQLPVVKGHILSDEDLVIRKQILDIMCNLSVQINEDDRDFEEKNVFMEKMADFEADGLLKMTGNNLIVTEKGKAFLRNICMAFDKRMLRGKSEERLFSKTV